MKVAISHPTGNANVRAVANGLLDAGLLNEFHTSIAMFQDTLLEKISKLGPLAEIKRRQFAPGLELFTRTHPAAEVGRILALKAGFNKLTAHEEGRFSIDKVYHYIDTQLARSLKKANGGEIKAVYAYEDAALDTFKRAKDLNMQCLYDLPIGYWRAARILLKEEQEKWPEWSQTLTGFRDSIEKLKRKDEELFLADKIYVASSFTAKTLQSYPGHLAPVEVVPYGFPPVGPPRTYEPLTNRRLKILFVGGLSQRKGIANLFKAVERFKDHVSLTVVGGKTGQPCKPLDVALAKHTWIPSLPHHKILELMRQHDVLIFPSLFEGFGLVITEAMSQGTPVITTDRTAGGDLINHGDNGWLIQAGSTTAIEETIENILLDPQILASTGQKATQTAMSRPWSTYSQQVASSVQAHLTGSIVQDQASY